MMMDEGLHEIRQTQAERLEAIFFCVLATFCFCLGAYYWVRLVGVFEDENWRFDLMNWQWRTLASGLAVLYPVVACGLWLRSKWGIILWIIGFLIEACCYLFLSNMFIFNLWLPFTHLVFLGIYFALVFYRHHLSGVETQSIAEY